MATATLQWQAARLTLILRSQCFVVRFSKVPRGLFGNEVFLVFIGFPFVCIGFGQVV